MTRKLIENPEKIGMLFRTKQDIEIMLRIRVLAKLQDRTETSVVRKALEEYLINHENEQLSA